MKTIKLKTIEYFIKIAAGLALLLGLFPQAALAETSNAPAVTIEPVAPKKQGDRVDLKGTTTLSQVTVKVLRPDRTILFVDVPAVQNGAYQTAFRLPDDAMAGTYMAVVGWGEVTAKATFSVTPGGSTPPPPGGGTTPPPSGGGGSGSGSGGGGSSGGGGTSPAPGAKPSTEQTFPGGKATITQNADGTRTVTLNVSREAIDQALSSGGKTVTLNFSGLALKAGDVLTLPIDKDIVAKIKSSGQTLEVALSHLSVSIPGDALDAFVASDGGMSLKVSVSELKRETVRIAAAPTTEVVSFAYAIEGPGSLNRPIDVTFILTDSSTDARKIGAYLKQADGSWKYIGGMADVAKKTLTAKMSRFGTVAAIAYHKTFADLKNHWAKDVVEVLSAHHIVSGKSEDVFAPNENVTRAEFAALMLNALGLPVERSEHPFRDVPEGAWYRDTVATAYRHGLMAGDGQVFRPNAPITREEMAVVLVNALGMKNEAAGKTPTFADRGSISAWAKGAVGLAQEKGLIRGVGDNRFAPKANAKRAEAAALLYNAVFQP